MSSISATHTKRKSCCSETAVYEKKILKAHRVKDSLCTGNENGPESREPSTVDSSQKSMRSHFQILEFNLKF